MATDTTKSLSWLRSCLSVPRTCVPFFQIWCPVLCSQLFKTFILALWLFALFSIQPKIFFQLLFVWQPCVYTYFWSSFCFSLGKRAYWGVSAFNKSFCHNLLHFWTTYVFILISYHQTLVRDVFVTSIELGTLLTFFALRRPYYRYANAPLLIP